MSLLSLYLGNEGLTFLKKGLIPFQRCDELPQPWLSQSCAYKNQSSRQISAQAYQQQLQLQYEKLPAHLKAMVTFEYFCQQSEKKRPAIEKAIKNSDVKKPDLTPLLDLRVLCLHDSPQHLPTWLLKSQQGKGLVLDIDPRSAGWATESYGEYPQRLAALKTTAQWLPDEVEYWLTHQPQIAAEEAGVKEWRLIRHLAAADKTIAVKQAERALYKLPFKAVRRIIFGYQWDQGALQEAQTYLDQDLNLRHIQQVQLAVNPVNMALEELELNS